MFIFLVNVLYQHQQFWQNKKKEHNELCSLRTGISNAAFTHAGLTTRYCTERKAFIKVFLCCQGHAIMQFVKRIESLLLIAGMKFEF